MPSRIEGFFNPESIAVFGASATKGKAGYNVLWNLRHAHPPRGLYPINPNRAEILGFSSYPDLEALPGTAHPLDLVVICLPPNIVEGALLSCIHHGVRNIIVESGLFGETMEDHDRVTGTLKSRLAQLEDPPRLMGPNSIGVVDLHTKVNTSLIPFETLPDPAPQGVAIVGQTGLIASGYLQRLFHEKPFPVSKVCCLGNKVDVNETDLIEYLRTDPKTAVVTLYLEDVREGTRFLEAAQQLALEKPVVLVKSGRSAAGAQAVSSHTGSLAGNDQIFQAIVRKTGLTRVGNFEDLWTFAQFFFRAPLPLGPRVGIVSITGAGCVLSVDAAEIHGMEIPTLSAETRACLEEIIPAWFDFTNPLDLWACIEQIGPERAYARATEALMKDRSDAVCIINLAMPESRMDWLHLKLIRAAYPSKPLVLVLLGGHPEMVVDWQVKCRELGIPLLCSPDEAIQILSRAWCLQKWRNLQSQEAIK